MIQNLLNLLLILVSHCKILDDSYKMNNSDITKEKTLLEFLKEYMLLAEIAYIESNAPVSIFLWVIFLFKATHIYESFKVMAILPSILSAATQGADMQEIQEAALFKESGSRILQMLLYVGLKWVFNSLKSVSV